MKSRTRPSLNAKEDINHDCQCDHRNSDQKKSLAAEQAKRRTVILPHDKPQKSIDQCVAKFGNRLAVDNNIAIRC
jgi:hypothetical protein